MKTRLEEKKSDLWKCINRVDTYISASNFRTALILTYVFAVLAACYNTEILKPINTSSVTAWVLSFLFLAMLFISSAMTALHALSAVMPDTSGAADSVYYFPGLTSTDRKKSNRIRRDFLSATEDQDFNHLYNQYVSISQIASLKFRNHKRAVSWAKYGVLTSASLLLLCHLFNK